MEGKEGPGRLTEEEAGKAFDEVAIETAGTINDLLGRLEEKLRQYAGVAGDYAAPVIAQKRSVIREIEELVKKL